jgi:2-polyprenyl-6-methoxyphenol hydroxylase-like FAD-dependent oxidoreductase
MKIVISGAGVAGPAFAHWMVRAGHEVTLVERAPGFRTGGYLIDFWGLGYRIAERMGIEADILAAGYRVREVRSIGADGHIAASLDVDPLRRVTQGRYTSLPRGDLAAAIYRTVEDDIETLFDDSIVAIDDRGDGVTVSFENTPTREFDMVIGADGLHSKVRELVFGPEASFSRFLGCTVAACVLDGYRPRDELVYVTHNVPGGQVGRFALCGDRTLALFIHRASASDFLVDAESAKRLLREQFGDAGWECPQLLDALDGAGDLYFDVVSQIRMDRWSKGRVALIGDAAACVSLLAGEGTGLAMVEAYVLAGELASAGGDVVQACANYEHRLRRFIERKQDGATRLIAFFAAKTRAGVRVRDLAMRALAFGPLWEFVLRRTLRDDIDLPDYPR